MPWYLKNILLAMTQSRASVNGNKRLTHLRRKRKIMMETMMRHVTMDAAKATTIPMELTDASYELTVKQIHTVNLF